MKYLIGFVFTLLFTILFIKSVSAQEPQCQFTISLSTSLVDGRTSPYNQIKPGDTICLTAGTRVPLEMRNIQGTADNPITIINSGGQVIINTSGGWFGFHFRNMQYFRFTGTGSTDMYGIWIQRSANNGIIFLNKTDNFEFDHIKIDEVVGWPTNGIAIQGQTTATTTADYDYNGDGVINYLDIVNRSNYTQHNFVVHDVRIDGGSGTSKICMGIYLGNSNTLEESSQPFIHGLSFYNSYIANTSCKAVQFGAVTENLQVYNNTVINATLSPSEVNRGAIMINPNCINSKIYNNRIVSPKGYGIFYYGAGGDIYNNVIIRPGQSGTYATAGISIQFKSGYSHSESLRVYNNTIISPLNNGIEASYGRGSIQNNIIVNPGGSYLSLISGYSSDHNLQTMNIANVQFLNSSIDDYHIASGSPAIDMGINVGLYSDFDGLPRPQGAGYDVGAYEYSSGATPPGTSSPKPTSTPVPAPKPGDANGDGLVNESDYQIWLLNYNQQHQGPTFGDFSSDGSVNGVDYIIWLNNYGE